MRKLFTLLALFAAVTVLPSRLQAGNTGQDNAPSANATTVTGCLQAGNKAGHYTLTADDGTTYHLRSKQVNLGEHVGHTVTVTGTIPQRKGAGSPSSSMSSDPNAQNAAGQNEGHAGGNMLVVTDLKMVSDSCKK
jgi:hypothetical protein